MITLAVIGISIKVALVLCIAFTGAMTLIGCNKDKGQCSICTEDTMYNGVVIHSATYEQTARTGDVSGSCQMSQEEFKQSPAVR